MHLIEYIDYEIKPTEELFLIKPFRELFFSDKTEHKDNFLEIISFIYHYVDPRSSYSYITDDDARYEEILKGEGIKNFKITKDIAALIEVYKKRIITTSVLLLQDTKYAVDACAFRAGIQFVFAHRRIRGSRKCRNQSGFQCICQQERHPYV